MRDMSEGSLPAVQIRRPRSADRLELLEMNRASTNVHLPWIQPPTNDREFDLYMQRVARETEAGFLICDAPTGAIAGVINLSNIVRGVLQSGYLSYYCGAAAAGRGYMTAGMLAVLERVFSDLQLHRVEANIQPSNRPSRALVIRCGFHQEGFSPRYLKIGGQWRDHERWALLAEEWHGAWSRE